MDYLVFAVAVKGILKMKYLLDGIYDGIFPHFGYQLMRIDLYLR